MLTYCCSFCCARRSFCTATRNYAKRQLNWYRKDHMFLFIDINRKDVPKQEAYTTAAEEVWHWATVPRAEFDAAVSEQVAVHSALSELRSRRGVPGDYMPDTPAKRVALSWLLRQGEYRVPGQAPKKEDAALLESERRRRQKLESRNARRKAWETLKAPDDVTATLAAEITGAKLSDPDNEHDNGTYAQMPGLFDAAADRKFRSLPGWVDCIFDESQGVTPATLPSEKPRWSAHCKYLLVSQICTL